MDTLIIDKARWYRGNDPDDSALRRSSDGKMCCLGFLSLGLGIPKSSITNVSHPYCLRASSHLLKFEGTHLLKINAIDGEICGAAPTSRGMDIARVNDSSKLRDETRIDLLKREFSRFGIDVHFSDKPQELAQQMREERAYYSWLNAGRPNGRELEFWQEAEEAIKAP